MAKPGEGLAELNKRVQARPLDEDKRLRNYVSPEPENNGHDPHEQAAELGYYKGVHRDDYSPDRNDYSGMDR